jgi:hypothetical protein
MGSGIFDELDVTVNSNKNSNKKIKRVKHGRKNKNK